MSEHEFDTRIVDGEDGGRGPRPPRVLISYRRSDTRGYAGWIYQWLSARFGKENVFKDIDTIRLGRDWRKVIQTEVAQCDALIALIGPRWLEATDNHGRRLQDEGDVLRAEIEHALHRDIPVVPVLVEDAEMPSAADLPESLSSLPDRQALRLTELHFDEDMQALANDLQAALIEREAARPSVPQGTSAADLPAFEPVGSNLPGPLVVIPPSPDQAPLSRPVVPEAPTARTSKRRNILLVLISAVVVLAVAAGMALLGGDDEREQGADVASRTQPSAATGSTGPTVAPSPQTSNASRMSIPDFGPADPYPSVVMISGIDGVVTDVNVTLDGLTHIFLDDLDILLVGPNGETVLLMADVGGNEENAVVGITITFDDTAGPLPDRGRVESGAYRPTSGTDHPRDGTCCGFAGGAPAPAPPYGTALSVFNGTNPNGTWSLYVFDDSEDDVGEIVGGWSLEIAT